MRKHYTAQEAKALLDGATEGPWDAGDSEYGHADCPVTDGNGNFIGSSPDDGVRAGFDDGDAQLIAAAPDLAATVIAQAEQIGKVREVRSIINQLITYSGEAISMDSTTLAKSIVNKLNDALGDTDG